MANELGPAIAALEKRLDETNRKANSLRQAINALYEEAGMSPKYADNTSSTDYGATVTQIQPDTFYGKKQSTAIRMYLELRKAQNLGPATPREIFEALKQGGYQFDAKDDTTALIGMRALLRKNTVTFHRLPNGSYGLLTWYPDAKPSRQSESEEEEDSEK